MFEPALCLDRGHATGACGRDCLTENRVLDIATGKDARNVRPGRTGLGLDVTLFIKVYHALEDLRIGVVADRDEQAVDGQFGLLLRLKIA